MAGNNVPKAKRYCIDPATGCWNWILSTNDRGYGQFQLNFGKDDKGKRITRTIRAHTHYWEQRNGSVPDGLELDHTCRNRRCVNPDHLEAVTHVENVRRSSSAKLTVAIVAECKRMRTTGHRVVEIAQKYGVDRTTISAIVNGKTWRDIAAAA